jgi:hypothetical protein
MPLEFQKAVLDLVIQVTGGTIESRTPHWLMRPGLIECGDHWQLVCKIYRQLTGLQLPKEMPSREFRRIDGILEFGGSGKRIVEIDESQHFNQYRGMTLRLYPKEIQLAFDRNTWVDRSQAKLWPKSGGGFAAPRPPLFPNAGGRHRQRAFRDALADILPPDHGFNATLRIADFEVRPWIGTECARTHMEDLLNGKISK